MMNRSNKWCLIGIPDHEGIINVGGRIGAANGPKAFERLFAKLRGPDGVQEGLAFREEAGPFSRDIASNHQIAAAAVRKTHEKTGLSVVVGGGHDHGYSHLLGISEALSGSKSKLRLGCINIDAHFDVRKPTPLISSGSPFYLALESGCLDPKRFIEFGIQRHCNATELWDYIASKKVEVVPFERLRGGKAAQGFKRALRKLSARCDAIVVSLDIDAAAEAFAPGVSAPAAEGFTSSEIVEMAEIAGLEKKVASLGIFELSPEHDFQDRTSRLAAVAAYHFIASRFSSSRPRK